MADRPKPSIFATLPPVAGAAVLVSGTMYPVDVIRAFCMANPGLGASAGLKTFLQANGMRGFVKKGLVAELSRASFSRGIKFWLQPIAHTTFFGTEEKNGTPISKGVAGALATIPEVMIITPLENMKIAEQLDTQKRASSNFVNMKQSPNGVLPHEGYRFRMMYHTVLSLFNGIVDTGGHLRRTRGIGGFYIGWFGVQMRGILWTGGFFLTLDEFKKGVSKVISHPLPQDVASGFLAGVFGTALCSWCDVIRSVIQKDAIANTFDKSVPRPSAFTHVNPAVFFGEVAKLYSSKGMRGLYAGAGVKCVHMGGSGALLAVLMPRFKKWWGAA